MKIKLISLLIALLCVSVLFVSCSEECTTHLDADGDGICDTEGCEDAVQIPEPEEPEKPNCTNHVDANNDKLCDTENCGTVIITNVVEDRVEVLVPIEKDEKIPMVIKPVPSDAVTSDYIDVDFENGVLTLYIHGYKPIEETTEIKIVDDLGDHYYIIKASKHVSDPVPASGNNEAKNATRTDTYTIVNDITDYTCELITTEPYEYVTDNPQTSDRDETWDDAPTFSFTKGYYVDTVRVGSEYYLFTKEHVVINEKALDSMEVVEARNSAREIDGICYITIKDTKYAIKDDVVIHSDDKMFMLHRPEFDEETDAFGIIEDEGTLYFYDLTKWIECTYSYTVKADAYEWFTLANGKVFVETINYLPDDSLNYDFIIEDEKVDVDYFIVDPAAKTVTETEFGYVVVGEVNVEELDLLNEEKIPNAFYVYSADEDGNVNEGRVFVVDNELNILCELDAELFDSELVADGLYVTEGYINGAYYKYVTNVNGKMLNYLPYDYEVFDDCIVLGNGDVYTYTLQLKLKGSEYDRYEMRGDYMLLWDTVKVTVGEEETTKEVIYYWNTTLEAPVVISDNTEAKDVEYAFDYNYVNNDYFVVKVAIYSEDEEPVVTGHKYQIYSYANGLLFDNVISWNYDTETIDGEVYKFLWVDVTIEGGHSEGKYILNDVATTTDPAPAA